MNEKIEMSEYKLHQIIRYYELKSQGNNVLAGILRTCEFPEINMEEFERALQEGRVKIKGGDKA